MDIKVVAVILARGGTVRIPLKNLSPIHGKTMISYPISAATNLEEIDSVVVSTDNPAIADEAKRNGASVPFVRPANLSKDSSPTLPVIKHAIRKLGLEGDDLVFCLYPTAIGTMTKDLEEALALYKTFKGRGALLFSCTNTSTSAYQALVIPPNGGGAVDFIFPDCRDSQTQDLPKTFEDAGQFYLASVSTWNSRDSIWEGENFPFLMSRHRVWDIDTPEDLRIAEALLMG